MSKTKQTFEFNGESRKVAEELGEAFERLAKASIKQQIDETGTIDMHKLVEIAKVGYELAFIAGKRQQAEAQA